MPSVFFVLFGSACVKAVRKMLLKSTPAHPLPYVVGEEGENKIEKCVEINS